MLRRHAWLSITGLCLLMQCLTLLAVTTTASGADLPPPVAFWPFERCEDGNKVPDAMRSGHDGQLIGGTKLVDSGYEGRALSFDGKDDAVLIEKAEDLLTGPTWTVSLWFLRYPQSAGGESKLRTILAVGDARNLSINAMPACSSQMRVRLNQSEQAFDVPFDMAWHHLVAVRADDKVGLYIDGKLLGSMPADTVSPGPLHLGHDGTEAHPSRHFNGMIDEVQVFDQALSPQQIASMYELVPPQVSEPFTAERVGGELGYHSFRIPCLLTAPDGTLLAFCEGRKDAGADYGNIDIVLRRSNDGGRTWGPLQVVWDDGPHTCGNPTPVVDRDTGRIWMISTHSLDEDTQRVIQSGKSKEGRNVWTLYSDDNGATWSKPVQITDSVKKPEWLWFATGPGVGLQMLDGRIVIPATRNTGSDGGKSAFALVFFSDDHGQTWHMGGQAGDRVSESQVVELADGRLMLSMRRVGDRQMLMCQSFSSDRGLTWSPVQQQGQLISPGGISVGFTGGCQASMLRYSRSDRQDANRLIFSNPANRYPYGPEGRINMTVRMSLDEGHSWAFQRQLYPRYSGYSCLTVLDDMSIGLLYAWGDASRYERILFTRINLPWLTCGVERAPVVPPPPGSIQAERNSAGQVALRWSDSPNADGWRVYRYVDGDKGGAEMIAELPGDQHGYLDQPPAGDRTIFYRAEPYNSQGCPPVAPVVRYQP